MPEHAKPALPPVLALLLLALLLQACIPGGAGTPPAATAPLPTATSVPTAVIATEPASSPVPEQVEAILIQQPGPGSRISSPARVSGLADPTFEQSLSITILTAEGTVLVTTAAQIQADVGQRGAFTADVSFNVAQEQQGFIQVYALSAKDGGVTHLASVGVTLLPGGEAEIRPATERSEQIVIFQPGPGEIINGGVVHVEGFGLASFEQTLLVEALDENGAVIASAPVTVAAPDLGQPGPFSADLPYSISAPTAGRIQVRDVSPAHGGNTHLSSVEVRFEP